MATLTLRNVPDHLHRLLKERAARNHRSLNNEAIHCLEAAVRNDTTDEADLLARITQFRERLAARGVHIPADSIPDAIEAGRP